MGGFAAPACAPLDHIFREPYLTERGAMALYWSVPSLEKTWGATRPELGSKESSTKRKGTGSISTVHRGRTRSGKKKGEGGNDTSNLVLYE